MASRLPIFQDRFGTPTDSAWATAAGVVLKELAFGWDPDRAGPMTDLAGAGALGDATGTSGRLRVIQAKANINTGTGQTSLTVTMDATTTAGNLLVAFVRQGSNQTDTPTITGWTLIGYTTGWATARAAMFLRENAPATSSVTVNYSTPGGVTRPSMVVLEAENAALSGALDTWVEVTDVSSGSSANMGPITTAQADELILIGFDVGGDQAGFTPATGFTIPSGGENARDVLEYRIVSSTLSSYSVAQTWAGGYFAQGIIAAFKQAGAASNDRTGTATDFAGAGSLGAPTAQRDVSGTVADLAGTGALGTPTANKGASGTVVDLVGAGSLSVITGAKGASSTAAALAGAGALGTADGAKASSSTASSLAGAGTLGQPTSSRAVSGTVLDLAGAAALGNATGTAGVTSDDRTGTALDLAGAGTLGQPTGTKDTGGPVAGLAGAAALGDSTGTRASSGTTAALAGTGSLGQLGGAKGVEVVAPSLVGAATYSTADGYTGSSVETRSGTATALAGTGALSSLDGARGAQGSGADLSGGGTLGVVPGAKGASPFALEVGGAAALGLVVGWKGATGTETLAGTGFLGSPSSTRASSGTGADLAGSGVLGSATGDAIRIQHSGTLVSLTGTGTLGAPTARSERTGWIRVLYGELLVSRPTAQRVSGGTCLPLECFGFRYLDVRGTRRDPAIWVAPAPGTEIRPAVFPYFFRHSGVCPARYGGECLCHPSDGSEGFRSP